MQSASDVISSLFWFKDEPDDEDREPQIIEQFVQNVEDFSSQYGSEISVSYTAFNLRGPPSNFPDYGDYPQAFVMVRLITIFQPSGPHLKASLLIFNSFLNCFVLCAFLPGYISPYVPYFYTKLRSL